VTCCSARLALLCKEVAGALTVVSLPSDTRVVRAVAGTDMFGIVWFMRERGPSLNELPGATEKATFASCSDAIYPLSTLKDMSHC